ncbi:S8 family serine peptidase [Algihabitans albus]|uniref:S8 family serine peptidase n=1 Tax=Algihabitans albus TaxID=2164067 RepID=UPI0035D0725B
MDATPELIAAAVQLGLTPNLSTTYGNLGLSVTGFALGAVSLTEAQVALAGLGATALAGNSVYGLAGGDCDGPACDQQTLVGWLPAAAGACGSGLALGMVDTAVATSAPALQGQNIRTRRFNTKRLPPSFSDHGTAIAGLLVGAAESETPGLLPEARLYAADVFHRDARGRPLANTTDILQALDWLAGLDLPVINMSLAGPANGLVERAVSALASRGTLVVAAAGNEGPTAGPAFPAAYPTALAVTAVDRDLRPFRSANRGDYLSLAAPGVDVWAPTAAGGAMRSGTSYAATFVAAAAADLSAQAGRPSVPELKRLLEAQARDLGQAGYDPIFGHGLLQAQPLCDSG